MTDAYESFLAGKVLALPDAEITDTALSPYLKPFQRDITSWALRRGRAALFEGTGLGKTLQQLSFARSVADHVDAPVIILAPLAVAHQTISEAEKFAIGAVAYAADKDHATTDIVVTNYDRMERFDFDRFAGVVLDESSIIKSHDSQTRQHLIEATRHVPFKLACTATPAPNDWVELGNHAEFLGVMSEKEMLATFFVHDGSVRAGGGAEWRLKGHAERAFWEWVSSWAVMIRSPADLGYDEPGYVLPPLRKHQITVPVEYAPSNGMLFPIEARTLSERIGARRESIEARVAAAVNWIGDSDKPFLIWCGLNAEQDALEKLFGGRCVSIRGADADTAKIDREARWRSGHVPGLICKPSAFGFGMNWQHCARMAFVGLNDSFEQLFQSIRRCWRFGQIRPVDVALIASELEGAVVTNLEMKERDHERMAAAMAEHMRDLTTAAIRTGRQQFSTYEPVQKMELPSWLAA